MLPENVLLVTLSVPNSVRIPPPSPLLPEKVLLVMLVVVDALQSRPPPATALLPEKVLSVTVIPGPESWPELKTPPPSFVDPEPSRTCRLAPVKIMCGPARPLIVSVVSTVTNWPSAKAFWVWVLLIAVFRAATVHCSVEFCPCSVVTCPCRVVTCPCSATTSAWIILIVCAEAGEARHRKQAHTTLAGIYSWFTEGFDTADLKDAKALLIDLG